MGRGECRSTNVLWGVAAAAAVVVVITFPQAVTVQCKHAAIGWIITAVVGLEGVGVVETRDGGTA